ncbi:MAG: helix-turn-helix transcriptional regulator [Candidatus Limnocylindria bacterium]
MDGSERRKRDRLARLLSVVSILYTAAERDDEGVAAIEIARLTGMNVRTVYRDLRALEEELDVPIFSSGRGRFGIERKFFLPPLRLTVPEAIVFFVAARLITQSSDEYDAVVVSAFMKLADALPQPIARHIAQTMLAIGERRRDEAFTSNFAAVARGWAEGRVVEFTYEGGHERRGPLRLRPYFIEPSAAGRSVYVIGFEETNGGMRTYKIERIRQASVTLDRYEIPLDFDADRWLAPAWGIWSADSTPPVTVRLRFDAAVARRVRESIWHRSQRLVELPDGRVELHMEVAGTVEVRPWILGWGDSVEVLEPPELRAAVAQAVGAAADHYRAGGNGG